MDDFNNCIISQTVNEYHTSQKQQQTLEGLVHILRCKMYVTALTCSLQQILLQNVFGGHKLQ